MAEYPQTVLEEDERECGCYFLHLVTYEDVDEVSNENDLGSRLCEEAEKLYARYEAANKELQRTLSTVEHKSPEWYRAMREHTRAENEWIAHLNPEEWVEVYP